MVLFKVIFAFICVLFVILGLGKGLIWLLDSEDRQKEREKIKKQQQEKLVREQESAQKRATHERLVQQWKGHSLCKAWTSELTAIIDKALLDAKNEVFNEYGRDLFFIKTESSMISMSRGNLSYSADNLVFKAGFRTYGYDYMKEDMYYSLACAIADCLTEYYTDVPGVKIRVYNCHKSEDWHSEIECDITKAHPYQPLKEFKLD